MDDGLAASSALRGILSMTPWIGAGRVGFSGDVTLAVGFQPMQQWSCSQPAISTKRPHQRRFAAPQHRRPASRWRNTISIPTSSSMPIWPNAMIRPMADVKLRLSADQRRSHSNCVANRRCQRSGIDWQSCSPPAPTETKARFRRLSATGLGDPQERRGRIHLLLLSSFRLIFCGAIRPSNHLCPSPCRSGLRADRCSSIAIGAFQHKGMRPQFHHGL